MSKCSYRHLQSPIMYSLRKFSFVMHIYSRRTAKELPYSGEFKLVGKHSVWPFNRVDQCLQVHCRLFWGQCAITDEGFVFLSYQYTYFNLLFKYCNSIWYEIPTIFANNLAMLQ